MINTDKTVEFACNVINNVKMIENLHGLIDFVHAMQKIGTSTIEIRGYDHKHSHDADYLDLVDSGVAVKVTEELEQALLLYCAKMETSLNSDIDKLGQAFVTHANFSIH